MNLKNTFSTG